VSIVIWLFANQPAIAAILLTLADIFALIPTIRKAWNKPAEESLFKWSLDGLKYALVITAVSSYNIPTTLNSAFWVVGCSFVVIEILWRKRVIRNSGPTKRSLIR
jgi:hypothetical protein